MYIRIISNAFWMTLDKECTRKTFNKISSVKQVFSVSQSCLIFWKQPFFVIGLQLVDWIINQIN